MLTLIVEIGMLVMGIIALVKGEVKLSQRKVVHGTAARILGGIMITPLPIAFMVGFMIAINSQASGKPQPDMMVLAVIELCIVGGVGVVALLFALATAQDPRNFRKQPTTGTSDVNINFPPPDPNNPYSPPHAPGEQPPPPNPFRDS